MTSIMRRMLLTAALSGLLGLTATAQTPPPGPPAPGALPAGSVVPVGNAVVSYVEILPAEARQGLVILKKLKQDSLKDEGLVSLVVLRRTSHANHFLLLEEWKDNAAREAHIAKPHVTAARAALKTIESAPYDERPHRPLAAGAAGPPAKNALYAVTHVDYVPVYREEGETALKAFASASRGAQGNSRFDVLTQASRPNHMTIVSTWSGSAALTRHVAAATTRDYRQNLLPRSGSIYDERLYRAVD